MKKLFLSSLATIAIALAACNGSTNNESSSEGNDVNQTVASEESAQKADEENAETSDVNYEPLHTSLVGSFKVEGSPNIESFIYALPFFEKEYEWGDETEIDKANGYFHTSSDGAGQSIYYGALWNRKDGKKLFIFSYRVSDMAVHEGHTKPFCVAGGSKFYYVSANKWYDEAAENEFIDLETGFAAYLYNPDTKEIESLDEPPFNGWSTMKSNMYLILPQKGKDIEVEESRIGEDEEIAHKLKWNGMTFDYEK